jgi:hypothetical protein
MIRVPGLPHPLTKEQVRDHFMLEDDTEDKPAVKKQLAPHVYVAFIPDHPHAFC